MLGRVIAVYEVREFSNAQRSGKVGSFIMGDDTGTIRIVLWNDQTKIMSQLSEGIAVKIADAYVKDNGGRNEIHVSDNSKIELNPAGEAVPEYQKPEANRKRITDLTEADDNVELFGTIVQVFEPRFFEVCPRCQKRVRAREDGFYCDVHGIVEPNFSYVLTVFLDDGSDNIRAVFFNNQTQHLLEKSDEDIKRIRNDPSVFDEMKYSLLGKIVKVEGRVNKNIMFDRIEFVARMVDVNVDAKKEMERIKQEMPEKPAEKPKPAAESTPIEESASDNSEDNGEQVVADEGVPGEESVSGESFQSADKVSEPAKEEPKESQKTDSDTDSVQQKNLSGQVRQKRQ